MPARPTEHHGDQRAADRRPTSEFLIACFSGSLSKRRRVPLWLNPPQTRNESPFGERVDHDEADRQEQEDVDEHRPQAEAERQEVEPRVAAAAAPGDREPAGTEAVTCSCHGSSRSGFVGGGTTAAQSSEGTARTDGRRATSAAPTAMHDRIMRISTTAMAEPSALFCGR